MIYSGLRFQLQPQRAHGVERAWPAFCRSLLDSCRQRDVTVQDAESLMLVFTTAETRAAVARGRVLERAQESWRRTAPLGSLHDCVAVDDVALGRQEIPQALPQHPSARSAPAGAFGTWVDVRRLFDIAGASLALLIASPLIALIALGIRLTSPGPILYRQRRVGKNGRLFTMLKFRTMHSGASEAPHRQYMAAYISGQTPHQNGAAAAKLTDDARIYPLGALLRQWSLDELPQLFNVLEGTMSLVGPRPSVDYELEHYHDWHWERLAIKPGITGPWQIYGRGRLAFDEMARMDIRYVRTRSVAQDLKFIALTIPAALGRTGAL